MTIGAFFGLNLATNALNMAQNEQSIIGNNISNSATPGYTEETGTVVESTPFAANPLSNTAIFAGQMGQGSTVATVTRNVNPYYNQLVRDNLTGSHGYDTLATNLQQVQSVFNEPSSQSLHAAMDSYFAAWQTLSASPEDAGAQQSVIQQGVNLADTFTTVQNQLLQVVGGLDSTLSGSPASELNQVNQDASQINTLNQQIAGIEKMGQNPNQLLDQRGQVLNDLAKLGNMTYSQNTNGSLNVTFAGVAIVSWNGANSFQTTPFSAADLASVSGGQIWANEQSIATAQGLIGQLGKLQQTVADSVNAQLKAGYENGTATPGVPMFTVSTAPVTQGSTTTSVTTLAVIATLTGGELAAASTPSAPGDGSNAAAIANLQNSAALTYGSPATPLGTTVNSYYSGMIATLGAQTAEAQSQQQTQDSLLQQSQNLQQSVSGVNVNDEVAQMIQFQNIFGAAAKFISIQNQMLQTLIQEA